MFSGHAIASSLGNTVATNDRHVTTEAVATYELDDKFSARFNDGTSLEFQVEVDPFDKVIAGTEIFSDGLWKR
jgi:hypothetical protein